MNKRVVSATVNFYYALVGGLPFLQDNGLFQVHFREVEHEPVVVTRLPTKVLPCCFAGSSPGYSDISAGYEYHQLKARAGDLTVEVPCDGRQSRTVVREVLGEIHLTYPTDFIIDALLRQ